MEAVLQHAKTAFVSGLSTTCPTDHLACNAHAALPWRGSMNAAKQNLLALTNKQEHLNKAGQEHSKKACKLNSTWLFTLTFKRL